MSSESLTDECAADILRFCAENEICDNLLWRVGNNNELFCAINCSDFFWWGTADVGFSIIYDEHDPEREPTEIHVFGDCIRPLAEAIEQKAREHEADNSQRIIPSPSTPGWQDLMVVAVESALKECESDGVPNCQVANQLRDALSAYRQCETTK